MGQTLGIMSVLLGLLFGGCGANTLSLNETILTGLPINPAAPPTIPTNVSGDLRTFGFGGWVGKSYSEHFQLRQLEISAYNTSGTSSNFSLLPGTALTVLLDGGNL